MKKELGFRKNTVVEAARKSLEIFIWNASGGTREGTCLIKRAAGHWRSIGKRIGICGGVVGHIVFPVRETTTRAGVIIFTDVPPQLRTVTCIVPPYYNDVELPRPEWKSPFKHARLRFRRLLHIIIIFRVGRVKRPVRFRRPKKTRSDFVVNN